jgi:hypothetical protein
MRMEKRKESNMKGKQLTGKERNIIRNEDDEVSRGCRTSYTNKAHQAV